MVKGELHACTSFGAICFVMVTLLMNLLRDIQVTLCTELSKMHAAACI